MLIKILICSSIICLAMADVNHLSRAYLPPSLSEVVEKPNKLAYLPPAQEEAVQNTSEVTYSPHVHQEVTISPNEPESIKAHDEPEVSNKQLVENQPQSVAVPKEASEDPLYGGSPIYGGFPNSAFPGQGFPGQFHPRPVLPPQVYPGQGYPSFFPPSAGFTNPNFPPQVYPGQGYPVQGFPGQSFPGQGFPGPSFINPGFPGQAIPNYPIYFSTSEKLQAGTNEDDADDKSLVRMVTNSDTQYDDTNGGYLYKKPSVIF